MTTLLGLLILGSIIGTIVLSIVQLYNPTMRRRTSAVAILASALSLLTMIGSIKTIDDKEDEINHLVDVHYQFADDVLTLLECEGKEACSTQMNLIINHLEKLYK